MITADPIIDLGARPGWAILVITIGVVIGLALIWFIVRQIGVYFINSSQTGDIASTLVLTLALLALVLIVGALVTGSDSAWTVAAAAVGAIAASLTSYFQRPPIGGPVPGPEELEDTQELEPVLVDAAGLDEEHLLPDDEWDDVVASAESWREDER